MPAESRLSSTPAPLVRMQDVSKSFARIKADPVLALDTISLTIQAGTVTGLVGPDGAGKTSLMRLMAGLVEPDSGEMDLFGRQWADLDRALIGYMPQHGGLYADLTVAENLGLFAELRGIDAGQRTAVLNRLYDATDLGRFRDRLSGQLSGGMRQKLAMACAVLAAPPLILLDEPSVGVDPVSRRDIWRLTRELAGPDTAIVWATSILEDAGQCDSVLLMHEGRVLYQGAPDALSAGMTNRVISVDLPPAARRPALRGAMANESVLDGALEGGRLRLVLSDGASPSAVPLPQAAQTQPASPRFADGFVDLLHKAGAQGERTSAIADAWGDVAMADSVAIRAHGLTKHFGAFTAADAITLEVAPGEIFGLLGPNGAGKSTTFRMLCGLLQPSSGSGSVAGHDLVTARSAARQSLGYMPQKFSLYGDLSVAANLSFIAGAYSLTGAAKRLAVDRVVANFALDGVLTSESRLLPLGLKQRLALACAVMHQPPVLFLDEPTSGVDPLVRREFWMHINALAARGVTIFITTHFMDEAEYCDRLALINRSQMIAMGSPDDLKARAAHDGNPSPTLEDAFIAVIDAQERAAARAAA